jgi:hypothetical protein
MKQKSLPLLTIVGLVAVLVLAMNVVEARGREAAPGQVFPPDPMKAGGPDCANPTVVGALPYSDTGNTCGAAAVVSNYQNATCLTVPYPGPELIYQIELFANNAIQVNLTPSALVDMGVFMVADCTTPTSCVDFHDAIGPGEVSQIPRNQSGPFTPGTYFLYVDSYYATGTASCGDYTLDVTGVIPVELINFSVE